MAEPPSEISSELESFRERWRAEVRAKKPIPSPTAVASTAAASSRAQQHLLRTAAVPRPAAQAHAPAKQQQQDKDKDKDRARARERADEEDEYFEAKTFGDGPAAGGGDVLPGAAAAAATAAAALGPGEPVSALEHYEKAVERESQGSLGDSLRLYRKAFRMDHAVDKKYKNKHFPAKPPVAPPPPAGTSSSHSRTKPDGKAAIAAAAAAAPPPPPAAAPPPPAPSQDAEAAAPLTTEELIATFAHLAIASAPPAVEGSPAPPCPIAAVPHEILAHVLRDVAVADVADFARLARACRRLAYCVATEEQVWRRVCLGPEWGFAGMHRRWAVGVAWEPLGVLDAAANADDDEDEAEEEEEEEDSNFTGGRTLASTTTTTTTDQQEKQAQKRHEALALALLHSRYSSSWQLMFRHRPRVRFNGCYISTVNYIRSGQASASQVTWGSPVHIVTYFRYLRLFRDGAALSLLHTAEPHDVVHHLVRASGSAGGGRSGGGIAHAALRGRWRLAEDGDLVVETQGVDSKYVYRLELALRSAGRGARNNKVVWRGHYSYNKLTDDWAEFGLKNDKPFFFSRVKSYGKGE